MTAGKNAIFARKRRLSESRKQHETDLLLWITKSWVADVSVPMTLNDFERRYTSAHFPALSEVISVST